MTNHPCDSNINISDGHFKYLPLYGLLGFQVGICVFLGQATLMADTWVEIQDIVVNNNDVAQE